MVRYYCDRCEKEFKSGGLKMPVYARDAHGAMIVFMGDGHLCDKCAKKFDMVKDRLKYPEEFFNMSNEDIALMEYDFKVGDTVVTSRGEVGVIEEICDCERCKERGFYEPKVKTTNGAGNIYITDNDKRVNFRSFYRIGKYAFGNVDIDCVEKDIESETRNIKESTERIEEYRKQLNRLHILKSFDEYKKIR